MVRYVTKNRLKAFLLSLFVVISSLSLVDCGGSFRSFPGEGDVSGSWNLVLTPSGASALAAKLCTFDQTDHNISGTTSDSGTVTGSVSGKDIDLTLNNADGTTTTLTGTVSDNWKEMSGTYTSTGSDGSGDWSATKNVPVQSLSVSPKSATLSCSAGATQTFTATGGTRSKYSVTATTNSTLVTISTDTLTTNGQFTVTANTCTGSSGSTDVNLAVTDTATTVNVTVTVTNP